MRRAGSRANGFRAGLRAGARAGACVALVLVLGASESRAGEVDVLHAEVRCDAESKCRVVATLRHADVGFGHYADAFEVLAPDETVLGTRILRHPHVHEQPFARALDGIELPPTLETVTIRGRDNVHGHGGREVDAKVMRPGDAKSGAGEPE